MEAKKAKKIWIILAVIILAIFGASLIAGVYNYKKIETQKVEAQKILAPECKSDNSDFDCYNTYYMELVQKRGVSEAFKYLKSQYETNSYVKSQCHSISHVIGHAGSDLYGTISSAYAHGDPFCWSGYYHGVIEEFAEKVGEENIIQNLDNVCSEVSGKLTQNFDYYNCVHGLGHGLMAITDNDVFKSLKYCDNLTGQWEKDSCYSGVFMENVMIDYRGEGSKYLKASEPMYPCTAVDAQYKYMCYLGQTSYALKASGYNFGKVWDECRVVDSNFINTCIQSLGRDASGQSNSDAYRTKNVCDMGKSETEKANCLEGAVKDFVSYYHSDVQAKSFCSLYSGELKNSCLQTAATYYKSF